MKHYITGKANKRQWLLTASKDGAFVDYETIIESDSEPSFWECYTIAEEHGCELFTIEELDLVESA